MTNKERLEDLLIEFDELGMMPTLIVPNPEERAKDWKRELTYAIRHLKAEIARDILSDLKKEIHDKAVYPEARSVKPYISLKVVDAIINNKMEEFRNEK